MPKKATSPKVAKAAGRLLASPKSSPKVKQVAGSALSQREPKKRRSK